MSNAAPLIEPAGWSALRALVRQRERLGFTRTDVAAAMGVDYTYVCALERGASKVSDRFRRRYAAALETLVAAKTARIAEQPR
ncbi:MAG: helix-turn-helix transcriptional regulator [Deltaproteobacteria bacterium]|nr:helix-turn-helix transcriptional regulator [Deltaproteobacteria bacterium]